MEPLLWSQVLFHSADDISQMIKRIEETFETLQSMSARKIQFLDMRIMKYEGKVEWAMMVTEIADLTDLESIKAQELIVLKYCQGLKPDDRLYDLLMEMEPKGWEQALKVIRKYVISQAVKAEMVDHRLKGQGHVINNNSGETRASIQSPGSHRKKFYQGNRGRDKTKTRRRVSTQKTIE